MLFLFFLPQDVFAKSLKEEEERQSISTPVIDAAAPSDPPEV